MSTIFKTTFKSGAARAESAASESGVTDTVTSRLGNMLNRIRLINKLAEASDAADMDGRREHAAAIRMAASILHKLPKDYDFSA